MSMPNFPKFDKEITCEHSLNMILASIAMEELALSHIINAEGEKLQYVLGTLESGNCVKPGIDEILKVNQSVTSLLDSILQNQMVLKNKMDKALHALAEVCPKPPKPPCPPGPAGPPGPKGDPGPAGPPGLSCKYPCKCSVTFKAIEKCKLWCPNTALHWDIEHQHGKCVCLDPCNKTKINLYSKGRFVVHFAANVRTKSDCKCNAAISLQRICCHKHTDIYTVHSQVSADTSVTMSMNGIIIDTYDDYALDSVMFTLASTDSLIVGNSMLSIIEI